MPSTQAIVLTKQERVWTFSKAFAIIAVEFFNRIIKH